MKKISITAQLKKPQTDTDSGTICYQIVHNRKTPLFPTGIRISLNEWNPHTPLRTDTRLRHEITLGITMSHTIAEHLKNNALSSTISIIDNSTRRKDESLLGYIQHHVHHLAASHRNGTATKYRSLKNSLANFSAGKNNLDQ